MASGPVALGPRAEAFRRNLRAVRTARGLDRAELARLVTTDTEWEMDAEAILRIEIGHRRATVDDVAALCIALRVPIGRMITTSQVVLVPAVPLPGALQEPPPEGRKLRWR